MTAEPIPFPSEPVPPFRRHGLGFCYEPQRGGKGIGIRLDVSDLRSRDGDLFGFVTVTSTLPGMRSRLHGPVKHNLTIDKIREGLPKSLTAASEGLIPVEDWRIVVDDFCRLVYTANRRRGEIEELGNQELAAGREDVVEKLVQHGAITNLFGPGGTGKGWLAIALALSVKYGRDFCGLRVRKGVPLYLDWEDSRESFIRRVQAVAAGLGLDGATLPRLRPVGTLAQNLDQVAEWCSRERADVVITDSVRHASRQVGEHGTHEDAAKDLFDACAAVGEDVAWLLIDHVSAEGAAAKLAGKPMNSITKVWDARVAWEARKAQEESERSLSIGLYHAKWNNTAKLPPLGFRLDFDWDAQGRAVAVRFRREDVLDSSTLAERVGLPERVLHLARSGPLTIPEVSEELEVPLKAAATTVMRLRRRGALVEVGNTDMPAGRGHVKHFGLADRTPERNTITLKGIPLWVNRSEADAPITHAKIPTNTDTRVNSPGDVPTDAEWGEF